MPAALMLGGCQMMTDVPPSTAASTPAAERGMMSQMQVDAAPSITLGTFDTEAAALAAWRAAKPPAGTFARATIDGRPVAIDSQGRLFDVIQASGEPQRPPQ